MSEELKPCPFCGSSDVDVRPEHIENAPGYGYTVYNAGHATITTGGRKCIAWASAETEGEAIQRWNTRATPAGVTAQVPEVVWSYDISPPPGFIAYVRANYSGDVHFHDPEWHALRLWNAAMKNADPITVSMKDVLRTVRKLIDGSRPKDLPGACMVIDSALSTPASSPVVPVGQDDARDQMRWALEIIAVGDATDAKALAADALVKAGLWLSTAPASTPAAGQDEVRNLRGVLELVRAMPVFDEGGPLADEIDDVLDGRPPKLLEAIDLFAHGYAPAPGDGPMYEAVSRAADPVAHDAVMAAVREVAPAGQDDARDAARWHAVEKAGSDLTLRLHYSRPDQRAAVIDAAMSAAPASSPVVPVGQDDAESRARQYVDPRNQVDWEDPANLGATAVQRAAFRAGFAAAMSTAPASEPVRAECEMTAEQARAALQSMPLDQVVERVQGTTPATPQAASVDPVAETLMRAGETPDDATKMAAEGRAAASVDTVRIDTLIANLSFASRYGQDADYQQAKRALIAHITALCDAARQEGRSKAIAEVREFARGQLDPDRLESAQDCADALATAAPSAQAGSELAGRAWVDDWMGRNDVVLRNEAYAELCAALAKAGGASK